MMQKLVDDLKQLLQEIKDQDGNNLQRAQILLCEADAMCALGALLYKLDGCDELASTMLKSELVMVDAYKQKVQKAVARQELSQQRKKTEVNIDAMHRFIEHAIPDLEQSQRDALKKVGFEKFCMLSSQNATYMDNAGCCQVWSLAMLPG